MNNVAAHVEGLVSEYVIEIEPIQACITLILRGAHI
jgi:hypothetical protein